MSKMRGKRLRSQAIGLGLIATCCGYGSDLKSYYPLDAGRTWSYALTIRREGDAGKPIEAASTVTNLPGRTLNGRAVTPQEGRQFGQIQLRFIAEETDGIAEIAAQSADDTVPQTKQSPNYVLKQPLREGTGWSSTWQSDQFGTATMIPINKRIAERGRARASAAGQFDDCLRLQISGAGTIAAPNGPTAIKVEGEEWYCADIGFVQGVFREEFPDFPLNTTLIGLELTGHQR
jgi:hypothetical protein